MSRSPFRGLFLPLFLLFAASACGDAGSEAAGGNGALDGPDRTLDWQTQALYEVGGFDAPDWATFGDVSQIAFDGAGNLYILDEQVSQVTVVSPEGEFLRTVGSAGEGPGELQSVFGMAVLPDGRVAISDFGHRAVVLYGPDGEWTGNASLDLGNEGLPGQDMAPLGSDRLFSAAAMRISMSEGGISVTSGDTEGGRPIWTYPAGSEESAGLAFNAWEPPPPPEGGESTLEGENESGGNLRIQMQRARAFTPALHVAPLPDGRLAVVDSVAYAVRIVEPGTGEVDRLVRPIDPFEVTSAIENQERDRRLAQLQEDGGGQIRILGGGAVQVDQAAIRRMMEDQVNNMVFYPEIPVIEALAADPLGRIWVQRSSGVPGEPGMTDLITADGRYLGSLPADGVRIPDAFGPDGRAAIIELDEYDVATVRVVQLPTEG